MTALLARSKKLGGDTSQNNTFSNSSRKVSNTFLHMSTRENSVYQVESSTFYGVLAMCYDEHLYYVLNQIT